MKSRSLSLKELRRLGKDLSLLRKATLNAVHSYERGFVLDFVREGKNFYLTLDLKTPFCAHFENFVSGPLGKKKISPTTLFLKAHFLGLKLQEVNFTESESCFHFVFYQEKRLAFFLRPGNLKASAGSKKITYFKPQPQEPWGAKESDQEQEGEEPSLEQIKNNYLEKRRPSKAAASSEKEEDDKLLKQKIKRIGKAQKQIREELAKLEQIPWKEVGDRLVERQSLDIEEPYRSHLEPLESFSWNVNQCYNSHKKKLRKKRGKEERLKELDQELAKLKSSPEAFLQESKTKKQQSLNARSLFGEDIKSLSISLDKGMSLVVGKNAKDNLRLLKKAKPWHYWFHIKDRPSAYGILLTPKRGLLDPETLRAVGHVYIKRVLKKSSSPLPDCEVVVAPCRYVTPLKGKLGGVTYKNELVFLYRA